MAVNLGIGYSQKQRVGPHRWTLTDKFGGGEEERALFAERFGVWIEGCFQVIAPHMLVKSDWAEWIHQGAKQVFLGHVLQLDCWQLLDRIAQFAGQLHRPWERFGSWFHSVGWRH